MIEHKHVFATKLELLLEQSPESMKSCMELLQAILEGTLTETSRSTLTQLATDIRDNWYAESQEESDCNDYACTLFVFLAASRAVECQHCIKHVLSFIDKEPCSMKLVSIFIEHCVELLQRMISTERKKHSAAHVIRQVPQYRWLSQKTTTVLEPIGRKEAIHHY